MIDSNKIKCVIKCKCNVIKYIKATVKITCSVFQDDNHNLTDIYKYKKTPIESCLFSHIFSPEL